MIKTTYLLFSIILLFSCAKNSNETEVNLDYKLLKVAFISPDCAPEKDACLMLDITYPRFVSGDSLAMFLANRIVKNSILDNIGMGDVEATEDPGIEEAFEELSKSFEELKNEFNDYSTGWQANISTEELYRSDSILVLAIGSMTYFGGAHPNYNIRYFNFERSTGRYLPISDFVIDLKQFTSRAEVKFKETNNIEDGTSYEAAGFDFLGDNFVLSANFAFMGDSIRLHYNHNEISSYAAGDFEITVSVK